MAFDLTNSAKNLAAGTNLRPSIVLEIDGVTTLYGCVIIKKFVRIGDDGLLIGDGWTIGGTDEYEDQSDLISLDGTTTTISQQLLQDKGGTGSVSSMQIALIDPFEEATKLITPGNKVEDLLGRGARVWLSFSEGAWPDDYVVLFRGIISTISGTSNIVLTVASPEIQKNQDIFYQIQTPIVGDMTNVQTTIPVTSVSGIVAPGGSVGLGQIRCYVLIDNELIEFTGINSATNTLTGCTRGCLGTIADVHTNGTNAQTFYRVLGNGPTLALQLLMSGLNGPWITGITPNCFVRLDPDTAFPNALYFEHDMVARYGFVVGDLITIAGATNPANNCTQKAISSIQFFRNGTLVFVDGVSFVEEQPTSAVCSFRSKYDTLGYGCALGGDEVDVAEFERLIDLFASSFPGYDFYIKDTITAREFVDTEILFPCGGYSLPRKGKISMGFTSPPVAVSQVPIIDSTQVINPDKTSVSRSIGQYLYNAVVYQYDEDPAQDQFNAGRITLQTDSLARIRVGNKPFTIVSKGLRNTPDTNTIMDSNARRFMERYKFAAELVKAQVQYGIGFSIEVGDVVVYGDNNLLLPDTKFGTRKFEPRLMEVVNKSMNIKTGEVSLDLLDTNYLTDGRYGIFSPSSILGSGNTATSLRLTPSFGIDPSEIESDKWQGYTGRKVIIHDQDWTTTYSSVLRGVSESDPNVVLIDAIVGTPTAGMVLDIQVYQDDSTKDEAFCKNIHCFWTPQIPVASGISGTQLTVSSGDAPKILPNDTVIVHNDWVNASSEVQVLSVVGTTVTLKTDIGFTPSSTYFLDLVGFEDSGSAYRFL